MIVEVGDSDLDQIQIEFEDETEVAIPYTLGTIDKPYD